MSLISSVTIKNFKCFRNKTQINLSQGTYLIGINNAGKTAILQAIYFFFNSNLYENESYLNRTAYLAKKAGYNQTEITIVFNLTELSSKVLKIRLMKLFKGKRAEITKVITFSPSSRNITFNYRVLDSEYDSFEEIDSDTKKLFMSVKVTYIHPQEGKDLTRTP